MSTKSIQAVLALGTAMVLMTGCGRKDSDGGATQGGTQTTPAASSTAGQASTVTSTATSAVQVVKDGVAAASTQVQGLIEQARTLVSEQKWAEALKLLSNLSQQDLTAEQKDAVSKLQEQAQQGVANSVKADAEKQGADAVNKLLTPKP